MNRYLMTRMEEAHLNPQVENLIFLALEALRSESLSPAFEEFCNQTPEEIAKILGWREDKDVMELIENEIEDKGLAFQLVRQGQDGFLAEVNFEKIWNISFKDDKPYSWNSGGVYRVHWIYASTIGELVEKILKVDEEEYNRMVEEARKKLETEKGEEKVV